MPVSIERSASPLILDVGQRGIYGMLAGFGFGYFNFRSWNMVRFTTLFGLGLGFGMNYM